MKEFFSKLWVKITAICLAVFLFLLSILLLFNSFAPYNPKCYHVFGLSGLFGSFNKNGNPTNYYQTEKTTNIVELIHISAINREVYYVWINVSDMEEDSTISLYNGPSSDTNSTLVLLSEYTLTGKDLQNDNDGWICIYDRTSTKDKYKVGLEDSTLEWLRQDLQFIPKENTIVIALDTPYDYLGYMKLENYICVYGYQKASVIAITKYLNGEFKAQGVSPIDFK